MPSLPEEAAALGGRPPSRIGPGILLLLLGWAAALGPYAAWNAIENRRFVEPFGAARFGIAALAALAGVVSAAAFVRAARAFRRGEPERFTGARVRLLVYAAVAALALQFAVFQPFRPIYVRTAVAIGFGLFGLVLLIGERAAAARPRLVRALDVLLMNLVIAAVLCELALRFLAMAHPSPLFASADTAPAWLVERHRLKPGQIHWGFRANAAGFYDEEFVPRAQAPGRTRILAIGDSFSVGLVPHGRHYTTVAERGLEGCDIYNMGAWGLGPREYEYLLRREGLALEPDLVVIGLFIGNDIDGSKWRTTAHFIFERDNLLIYQVPRRLAVLAGERRARREGPAAAGAGGGGGDPEAEREEPFALVGGAEMVIVPEAEAARSWPWLADPRLEPPVFSRARFLEIELEHVANLCGERIERLETLFHYIEEIRRRAGDRPLAFVLIPDSFQVEDSLWAEAERRFAGRPLDRDKPQREIGKWLETRGLPYLDLLPALRAVPPLEDGDRHLYHKQDTHWNARGNEEAGKAMAAFLRPLVEKLRRR